MNFISWLLFFVDDLDLMGNHIWGIAALCIRENRENLVYVLNIFKHMYTGKQPSREIQLVNLMDIVDMLIIFVQCVFHVILNMLKTYTRYVNAIFFIAIVGFQNYIEIPLDCYCRSLLCVFGCILIKILLTYQKKIRK